MEVLWNKVDLERPPNISWYIPIEKFDKREFDITLDRAIKDLESQHALHTEAALLSRYIYRTKCKFRTDKGLKNMEKVNRALLNYLSLALEKEYKNLRASVDAEKRLIVLPSKQMLQYTLIRTQGFAKLMCRVEEVARYSAIFFKSRIHIGHAWVISTIAYAVVSRIWILSRHLIKKSCVWYNGLYRYLDKFKMVGMPWCSGKFNLPVDLKSWLSLTWLDEDLPSVPNEEDLTDNMFKLITPLLDTVDIDLSVEDNNEISINKPQTSISADDIGEQIDRNSFMLSCKKENAIAGSKRKLSAEDAKIAIENSNFDEKANKSKKRRKETEELVNPTPVPLETEVADNLLANITTKSDLLSVLSKKSYPGLEKSRWKTIRKNGKQLVGQMDEGCSERKQAKFLRKAVRTIQGWME